jgi:biotin carboxylase
MHDKPTFVLLAARGPASYAVLKALHAIGVHVEVICDCRSSLRVSRYGETLYVSRDLSTESPHRILDIINDRHRRNPVELVLATDVAGMMLLNTIHSELLVPVFPAANNVTLGVLDNKWSFNRLCRAIGVTVPESIYFESKDRLDLPKIERELGYPVVVKPVDESGGHGLIVADCADAIADQILNDARYCFGDAGLIVQRYVRGRDWGYGAFCVDGQVRAAVAFKCGPNWSIEICNDPDFLEAARRIIEHTRYTGVLNFDCRFDEDERTFQFLECNPRFFVRVNAARLCGVNFCRTEFGEKAPIADGVCYFPIRHVFTREGARCLAQKRWPLSVLGLDAIEIFSDPITGALQNAAWRVRLQNAVSPWLQKVVSTGIRMRSSNV